jgi:transcriptional regulator with PAS, ATPase and Fis domain
VERGSHPSAENLSLRQGLKEMIKTVIERNEGNISKAAKELKIARSTLYRKIA